MCHFGLTEEIVQTTNYKTNLKYNQFSISVVVTTSSIAVFLLFKVGAISVDSVRFSLNISGVIYVIFELLMLYVSIIKFYFCFMSML